LRRLRGEGVGLGQREGENEGEKKEKRERGRGRGREEERKRGSSWGVSLFVQSLGWFESSHNIYRQRPSSS